MGLQTLHNSNQKETDDFLAKFSKELKAIIADIQVSVIASLKGLTEKEILSYEIEFKDFLQSAGYYVLINTLINTQFKKVEKGVSELLKTGGFKGTSADAIKVKALKELERSIFTRLADDVALVVKKQLYEYALADASLSTMSKSISKALTGSNLARYSETYARTAIGNFQQGVINISALGIKNKRWVYVGVRDDKNRPYCSKKLIENRTYNNAQKIEIENNPARAWNCRHRLYPVSPAFAKEAGYV